MGPRVRGKSFFQKTLEARGASNRPVRGRPLGRVRAAAGARVRGGDPWAMGVCRGGGKAGAHDGCSDVKGGE